MTRWIRTGALAFALGLPGTGLAQTAPPAPKTAAPAPGLPQVGELLTFRTSGQPERQVRILRVIGTPETDGLADVQDLGTGAKYSVPLKIVALMARTGTPTTAAAPAARPTPATPPGLPSVTRTFPSNPPPQPTAPRPSPPPQQTAPRPSPPPPQRLLPSGPEPVQPPPARPYPAPIPPPAASRPYPKPADDSGPKFRAVVPTVAVEVTPPKPVVKVEPAPVANPTPVGKPVVASPPPPKPAAPAVTFALRKTPEPTPVLPAIPDVVVTQFAAVSLPETKASRPAVAASSPAAVVVPGITIPDVQPTAPPVPVQVAAVTPGLDKPVRMLPPPPARPGNSVVAPPTMVEPPKYVVVPVAEYAPEQPKAPAVNPAPVVPPPAPARDVVVVRPPAAPPVTGPAASPEVIAKYGPPPVVPLAEPRTGQLAAAAPPRMLPPPPATPVQYTAPSQFTPPAPAPEQLADRLAAPPAAPEPSRARPELPAQMMDEVQPFVNELFQSVRPSLRERAATALAEGRYGSRPEVKATLARAAQIDPAAEVKAHCINLLSTLGYHEAGYLGFLGACAESGEPAVKQAARTAINKLTRR